jgi:co-chaperonin GroES (HSP10)
MSTETLAVLEPLGNRILVRLRALPEKTGLIIRVDRNESAREADVISVGPEVRDVEAGQVVLVSTLAGQAVGDSIILPESSVLAFVSHYGKQDAQ